MTSISAAQPGAISLSAQQADRFARAVSQRMGRALGNRWHGRRSWATWATRAPA